MSIFYYDDLLAYYEMNYMWNKALDYLERLYSERREPQILYSLIGFSWFYLVEGPLVSKQYENDQDETALIMWKKYIDVGKIEASDDPLFNYIAGYTLSLHGIYINDRYEAEGSRLMKLCSSLAKDTNLKQLADNFLLNEYAEHYTPICNGELICSQFFDGKSLLDEYFNELFNPNMR